MGNQMMLMEKEIEAGKGTEERLKEAQKAVKELERRRNMTQKEIK